MKTRPPKAMDHRPIHVSPPLWDSAIATLRDELKIGQHSATIWKVSMNKSKYAGLKTWLEDLSPDVVRSARQTHRLTTEFSRALRVFHDGLEMLTALVSGSLQVILQLASDDDELTLNIIDILEDMSLQLPWLKFNDKEIWLDQDVEKLLVDIYSTLVSFYARAIRFLRSNKRKYVPPYKWDEIDEDSRKTTQRLGRLSVTAERMIHYRQMRLDQERLFKRFESQTAESDDEDSTDFVHNIPSPECPAFCGRDDILGKIENHFFDKNGGQSLRSYVLHGMGGAGKTQIALRYAHASGDNFAAVFWVNATDRSSIKKSYREISKLIETASCEKDVEDATLVLEVKNWLSTLDTVEPWLLIFDGADDISLLKEYQPSCSTGCILVTSRDPTAIGSLTSSGCKVDRLYDESEKELLSKFTGRLPCDPGDEAAAQAIAGAFSGLPLALGQAGMYMAQKGISLKEFWTIYSEDPGRFEATRVENLHYEHTLATVWDTSVHRLDGDSKTLLGILAFLDISVQESFLLECAPIQDYPALNFLKDRIGLLDAEECLLRTSLISRGSESQMVSFPLIKRPIICQMSIEDRELTLCIVAKMLLSQFPDTNFLDVRRQVASWPSCERVVPHLKALTKQAREHQISLKNGTLFGDLLLRASWYLYENERYGEAREYLSLAIESFPDRTSLAYASAIDLQGLMHLGIGRAKKALESFRAALILRTATLEPEHCLIAASLVNIGLAYTDLGDLLNAKEYLQRSIDIRLKQNSDRIGNSYSNMASLLLRMGNLNEAEEMLKKCPSLTDFTDETFAKSGNPRFSGDMVLLSRIRSAQGRQEEALKLALKALEFRREYLSENLKVCETLYIVAGIHRMRKEQNLAFSRFQECIAILNRLEPSEGRPYLARVEFRMACLLREMGKLDESDAHLKNAEALRDLIISEGEGEFDHATAPVQFDHLVVPWMLS